MVSNILETSKNMINLEIKIRILNSEEIKKKVLEIKAKPMGILHQFDTYFIVGNSRLKLREEKNKSYFVYYKRPDILDSKFSKYYILNIPIYFSRVAKKLFSFIFDVKVVIKKTRDLFLYKNTRIHLDKVDNLGEFIEIETVFIENDKEDDLKREHYFVIDFLGLKNLEKVKESYSDLMLVLPNIKHTV